MIPDSSLNCGELDADLLSTVEGTMRINVERKTLLVSDLYKRKDGHETKFNGNKIIKEKTSRS